MAFYLENAYHCILNLRPTILILLVLISGICRGQNISIATDLTTQHNFSRDQQYTTIGQTVQANFMATPREGLYVWFAYYANGKFSNSLKAIARSTSTSPSSIDYLNRSKMRLKHFSLGYKRYLLGSSEREDHFNLYVYAGFGLELGRVINTHSVSIDTLLYDVPVLSGQANFKRLTIDPGIGIDRHLAGDIYFYSELRLWISTTDYPSRYIYKNENAPWTGMFCAGLRVLF